MLISVVIGIHVAVCLTLVGIVLLQQGRGADVGAVFGGSSQTVFGASGAGNLLTKTTWVLAVVFFATSLFLAYTSSKRSSGSIFEGRSVSHQIGAPVPLPMKTGGATAPIAPVVPRVPAAPKATAPQSGVGGNADATAPLAPGLLSPPVNPAPAGGGASSANAASSAPSANIGAHKAPAASRVPGGGM